jgi:hypothetical protein
MKLQIRLVLLAGCALLLAGCKSTFLSQWLPRVASGPVEHKVTLIPLAGPLAERDAELSGLARLDDELVLLPQYPALFGGNLFTLADAEIVTALAGVDTAPLTPAPLAFDDGGLAATIPAFEGFESLAIAGDRVYMTIEAQQGGGMTGYLVAGAVDRTARRISLDPATLVAIAPQAALSNLSDEAITVLPDGRLLTFYEANGANVNPQPVAHRFETSGAPAGSLPSPTLEYRLTDATPADAEGRFWAINYFFPNDEEKLAPAIDELAARDGEGLTHAANRAVERLVEMQVTEAGVVLTDRPPLQLRLLPGVARNWEGIAQLNTGYLDGFLLVTDTFPATMLAFVER